MSAPTILLIGCSGQVGGELARLLAPLSQLIVTDIPAALAAYSKPAGVAGTRELLLTHPEEIRKLVLEIRPQIIIIAAAYTAVDRAETDRELCSTINASAPGWIGSVASEIGATVIHYSTDYVFDGSGEQFRRESEPTGPLNWYGATKLAGEKALLEANPRSFVFRTSWVVSAIGNNFIKTMLRFGAEREELRVVADQIGAPTTARAIAQATLDVVRGIMPGVGRAKGASIKHGVYHMVCRGVTSWHGLAEETFAIAKRYEIPLRVRSVVPIRTTEWPTPAQRPLNSRLDCTKLRTELGIELPDWKTAISDVIADLASSARTS